MDSWTVVTRVMNGRYWADCPPVIVEAGNAGLAAHRALQTLRYTGALRRGARLHQVTFTVARLAPVSADQQRIEGEEGE